MCALFEHMCHLSSSTTRRPNRHLRSQLTSSDDLAAQLLPYDTSDFCERQCHLMTIKHSVTVLALLAVSSLGIRGAGDDKRAHLSDDLLGHVGRHTSARTRVIVHGDAAALAALT